MVCVHLTFAARGKLPLACLHHLLAGCLQYLADKERMEKKAKQEAAAAAKLQAAASKGGKGAGVPSASAGAPASSSAH